MKKRCHWCERDPLYVAYHDEEWGAPVHEEHLLFEFLVLEGMQAGLNWFTILKKRQDFRKSFAHFDPKIVAEFSEDDVERLLLNPKILRHRGKIRSAINNAQKFLEMDNFDRYIWGFTDGKVIQNVWRKHEEVPCQTEISDKMAKDLKQKGFQFVGSKMCYSFMQAIGMVNDHLTECYRHAELLK